MISLVTIKSISKYIDIGPNNFGHNVGIT